MDQEQRCRLCGQVELHYLRSNGKLQDRCVECNRTRNREKYAANREAHKAHVKRNKATLLAARRRLRDELKSVPCTDCGIQYPPYVMQFDHVRGLKNFDVGQGILASSWKVLHEEIAKCEIVCANCHAERTHQRRKSLDRSDERE